MEATIEYVMVEHARCPDPVLEDEWRERVGDEAPALTPWDELKRMFAPSKHASAAFSRFLGMVYGPVVPDDGIPGNVRTRFRLSQADRCWACGQAGPLPCRWLSAGRAGSLVQHAVGWCMRCLVGPWLGSS